MVIARQRKLTTLISDLHFARDRLGADVTVQRLLVFITVYLHEGASQNELRIHLPGISVTALSRNLADLSAWTSRKTAGPGLVELRSDPANLRKKHVYLTTFGIKFFDDFLAR